MPLGSKGHDTPARLLTCGYRSIDTAAPPARRGLPVAWLSTPLGLVAGGESGALASCIVLHDVHGPVERAEQILTVRPPHS
ncbi:hypothetical protein [Streptomyces sp. NPDC056323]|uniref:hypothetical protein n=1 Tax=unclassified Streptomyces TaxID=2593676 RepID=UPI0035D61ACC